MFLNLLFFLILRRAFVSFKAVTMDFILIFRTFDYIQRELPKVPTHIPVLILGSHRDMGHHRVVEADTVRYYIENLER